MATNAGVEVGTGVGTVTGFEVGYADATVFGVGIGFVVSGVSDIRNYAAQQRRHYITFSLFDAVQIPHTISRNPMS